MLHIVGTEWRKYETLESAKDILEKMEKEAKDITKLDISFNTYTPQVIKEIGKVIKKMKNLRSLKAESILDTLTTEEVSEVIGCLGETLPRNLASLELMSDALSYKFPSSLEAFFEESSLNELVLHDCGLGELGAKRVFEALKRRKDKKGLISLDISKNRINRLTGEFGRILSEFTNLQKFNIRSNTIEEKGLSEFLDAFDVRHLSVLDLSDNFVCGLCIKPLCAIIRRSSLSKLNLYDAKMGEGEINEVLQAIESMPSDELPGSVSEDKSRMTLDISCIYFNQDTVPYLLKLAKKFVFERLILFENDYTDIEELKKRVTEDGGVIIDDEDDLNKKEVSGTAEIMEKIQQLGRKEGPL